MVQRTLSLSRQAKNKIKKGVRALFHMHQQQADMLRLPGHAGRCLIFLMSGQERNALNLL